MNYPVISDGERNKKTVPAAGKIKVVIDTDAFNEVDDQFAIAYALLSPERIQVEAVYAAPFSSNFFDDITRQEGKKLTQMTSSVAEGVEQSYQEILKIFQYLEMSPTEKVFRGSPIYLRDKYTPVPSEAAKDLVKRAMESEETLYVAAIGAITNIASAILMEPRIIEKIVVVWLAGQPLHWPHTLEFNLGQDVFATQVILESKVPLVMIPCMSVASHLTTTKQELIENLSGKSKIGTFLADTATNAMVQTTPENAMDFFRSTYLRGVDDNQSTVPEDGQKKIANSRIIWDISAIGYLIQPSWCPSNLVTAPKISEDICWELQESGHQMRLCHYLYRDCIFGDMFQKLRKAP